MLLLAFAWLVVYTAALYWVWTWMVSAKPDLPIHKVIELLAVVYDIGAAILLSQLVVRSEHVQRFVSTVVAEHLWVFYCGMMFAGMLVGWRHHLPVEVKNSGGMVILFAYACGTPALVGLLEDAALPHARRAAIIGLYFLFGGLALHLVAAWMDMFA